ncbi:hypothetical protein HPQ64_07955 [Rhizobiales bacterium]|uniref:anti-sigma factor family protein n=1 Tax=Hongsoonwoonella zoysiae TaxID=2821844 RepID=UPI00155FE2DD|nr:hypothetical protein [Hongsoonwoonella zoysiae]NRG17618.1 hypothetical protein [Hongsoonwoonella zoysiae]
MMRGQENGGQEHDWVLLNGFADGELDAAQSAALQTRLDEEPELQAELDRILKLKAGLASLRPAEDAPAKQAREGKRAKKTRERAFAAIAACLVAAVMGFSAWQYLLPPNLEDSVFALHERLARQTYVVEEGKVQKVVSTGRAFEFSAPDMTASRLFLVDVETGRAGESDMVGLHYRGLRGCRLTLIAVDGASDALPMKRDGLLVRNWAAGGFGFVMVASGMDAERFEAVGEYAEAVIRDEMRRLQGFRTAMSETAARPCA